MTSFVAISTIIILQCPAIIALARSMFYPFVDVGRNPYLSASTKLVRLLSDIFSNSPTLHCGSLFSPYLATNCPWIYAV
jgi:hypothetical protein